MKLITLTQGLFAMVDDDDFDHLNQWKWHAQKTKTGFYAARTIKKIMMHRVIMKTPVGMDVDHIDHVTLNNQKSNLRNCTRSQNVIHTAAVGISKYKGVTLSSYIPKKPAVKRKWQASIIVNGQYKYLGHFQNEMDAAKAYNDASLLFHKEFAQLNQF